MTLPTAPGISAEDLAILNGWYALFLVAYPEFTAAPQAAVEMRLQDALRRTPEDVWGDHHREGVLTLAAHLVAMSPGGEAMRLAGETTIYKARRDALNRIVASGFRVAGLPPT